VRSIKYGNKPKIILGVKFHSTKEANRYLDLLLLIKSGEISDLELQVAYPILLMTKKYLNTSLILFTWKMEIK